MAPTISYRIAIPEPQSHLAEVEMRVAGAGGDFTAAMAAWCPGSYLIRDYARFVRDLEVTGAGGQPLRADKIDKQSWRVEAAGEDEVVIRYKVYGNDLSVRTNHIDDSHAFLHGPALYLYLPEHRDAAATVDVQGPPSWHVATSLPAEGGRRVAADVDELLDAPIHLGEAPLRHFRAADRDFTLALWGVPASSRVSVDELIHDLTAVVDLHAARFGGAPFSHYTFILMLSPGAYGGLEHQNSSANLTSPLALSSPKAYQDLLELLSHEFFHAWNGKRLMPAAWQPFDYSREQHTRCLWVVEGITSYIDRYAVRAAKRMPVKRYFTKLCEDYARLQMTPGRLRHSLEDASFDAWIKLYKPDESNLNTTVSYYLEGGLAMTALDLELRKRAATTLDDVLRHLWDAYGARGQGYPEDLQADFEAAASTALGDFFDQHIRNPGELDLGRYLAHVGLGIAGIPERPDPEESDPVWLGVHLREGGQIAAVIDGSPAAAAGLSPGDELVALGGYRVRGDGDVRKLLGAWRSGQAVEIAVFRRDQLALAQLTLEPTPPTKYEIRGLPELSATQRELYEGWMGEAHPGPGELLASTAAASWV